MLKELTLILMAGVLVNNYVLQQFLGICPFLGVSKKLDQAVGMGVAVTFVMLFATAATWPIYNYALVILIEVAHFIEVIEATVKGEEGEIILEILEAYILGDLKHYLIIGTVLVGVRHLQMAVIRLDLAVVRKIIHIDIAVGRAVGVDLIIDALGGVRRALSGGIFKEIESTNAGMLRLISPQGGRHCAEIGQSPMILSVNEIGGDTVGLGSTY